MSGFESRRIEGNDFDCVMSFCYRESRSEKLEAAAREEFETLVGTGQLVSTVLFDSTKGRDSVVGLLAGAFLAEGMLERLQRRQTPDVQRYLANCLTPHPSRRGSRPFATVKELQVRDRTEGNDFITLYLGFNPTLAPAVRRDVELKTFKTFFHEWAGHNIVRVAGEIWNSDQQLAADHLCFDIYNKYQKWHSRRDTNSVAPVLMGIDRDKVTGINSLNILHEFFHYERPIFDLPQTTKELIRFGLGMQPHRDFLDRKRLNKVLSEQVYPLVKLHRPLKLKLERLHADGQSNQKGSETRQQIVLEYFRSHPWELRP